MIDTRAVASALTVHRQNSAEEHSRDAARVIAVVILAAMLYAGSSAQTSPHGQISIACEDCHTALSWNELANPMRFDHASTGFKLQGQHALVKCRSCHASLKFQGTANQCSGCHDDLHRGELGSNCARCHTPEAWLVPDMPQRHSRTSFPLVGRHLTADCQRCHPNQQKHQYVGVRTDCYSCHAADYEGSQAPNHRAAGFGTDCSQCHAVNDPGWGGGFDHVRTGFPLAGAHASTPCSRCHTGNNFRNAGTQCIGCHQQQFTAAASPRHTGFSTDCLACHSMTGWKPATFDHNRTAFRLIGAHVAASCTQCHANGVFAGTPAQCVSCHQQNYANAANPRHSPGMPTDCTPCHTSAAWRPSGFDHNRTTFPLTGAHMTRTCGQCHANGIYAGTAVGCSGCHLAQANAVANPSHASFPTDCATCHTTMAWRPSTFDHNRTTFPLTGAHPAVSCTQCHRNGVYAGTPTQCSGCHLAQANAAVNPSHAGFPTDCATCHMTTAWRPSTFDHNRTRFALTGAHLAVACNQCHTNAVFAGTPATCGNSACHLQDYTNATNPRHGTGFSTDCASCHTTTAWQPATFDHSKASYPLTGAHLTAQCAACHKNGIYTGTPNTCGNSACHLTQYNATASPSHIAAAFPLDCQVCHTTTAWKPSTWNHDPYFPISAGSKHPPGRWNVCTDCHTVPTNYTSFSCINCHAHSNQSVVDEHHKEVAGYSYNSAACYRCHPQGRSGGGR